MCLIGNKCGPYELSESESDVVYKGNVGRRIVRINRKRIWHWKYLHFASRLECVFVDTPEADGLGLLMKLLEMRVNDGLMSNIVEMLMLFSNTFGNIGRNNIETNFYKLAYAIR